MKLTCVTCAAFCLAFAFVSAAEESADPSIASGDVKVSNLEQDGHGPLMKALLAPAEKSRTLNRQKRTFFKGKGGGGGGCCGGGGGGCCGGGGGGCGHCGGGGGGGYGGGSTWSQSSSQSSAGSRGYGKK